MLRACGETYSWSSTTPWGWGRGQKGSNRRWAAGLGLGSWALEAMVYVFHLCLSRVYIPARRGTHLIFQQSTPSPLHNGSLITNSILVPTNTIKQTLEAIKFRFTHNNMRFKRLPTWQHAYLPWKMTMRSPGKYSGPDPITPPRQPSIRP